jgi:hypothetical protein
VIKNSDNHVTWTVDGTVLVDADITGIALGGNNIALGVSDVNATTARHPSLAFLIVDNVLVTDVPPAQLGDFNSDGKVDAGDYDTWRKAFDGSPTAPNTALANDGGLGTPITTAHYNLWRANFGNPPGAGSGDLLSASIPEPSSMLLLVFGAGCCCWSARKR